MKDTAIRIVCVGNRFQPRDALGPRVHDALRERGVPAGVELIDGGLAGIDLLHFVEGCQRVVFVDALSDDTLPDGVYLMDRGEAARTAGTGFDHAAGLAYLLRMIPEILGGAAPEIRLVAAQGPPAVELVDQTATVALAVATGASPANASRGAPPERDERNARPTRQ
jgi:hydrogenase maturation protease